MKIFLVCKSMNIYKLSISTLKQEVSFSIFKANKVPKPVTQNLDEASFFKPTLVQLFKICIGKIGCKLIPLLTDMKTIP